MQKSKVWAPLTLCALIAISEGSRGAAQAAPRSPKSKSAKGAKAAPRKTAAKNRPEDSRSSGVRQVDGVMILSGGGSLSLPSRPDFRPVRALSTLRRAERGVGGAPLRGSVPGDGLAPLAGAGDERAFNRTPAPVTTSPGREVGDKLFPPQFETLDADGQRISLRQYVGKVVLIDFWATWCPPSRVETPALMPLYEKHHSNGLEIIGISLDVWRPDMNSFVRAHGMQWRQIFGGKQWKSDLALLYDVQSIPDTILLDRDGSVLAVGLRGEMLEEAVALVIAGQHK